MSWFRRRERATLQLYGKLPLAKDYLRVGMSQGPALALRDWLDHAFSGVGSAEPPQLARAVRFLVGDGGDGCLQGVAWPSSDVGGLRPFPFVLCLERKRRALIDDLLGDLGRAQRVWAYLARIFEDARAMPDGGSVLAKLRGTTIDVDGGSVEDAGGVELDTWIGSLWPTDARDGLYALLAELRALAGAKEDPIRLPLVADLPLRPQVRAWSTVLRRLEVSRDDECPTLFFPLERTARNGPAEPAFLTLLRRPPRPADAIWLEAPTGVGACGPGDFCAAEARLTTGASHPLAENLPSLSESIRGPITRFLARSR